MSEIVATGFGFGVLALVSAYIYLSFRDRRMRYRYELEARHDERRYREYEFEKQSRMEDRPGGYDRLSSRLADELEVRIRKLEDRVGRQQDQAKEVNNSRDGPPLQLGVEKMLRQLSHSMGTPLSRIKADALAMDNSSGQDPALRRIVTSVDLANAYLASYRQLAAIDDRTGIFDDESLQRSARRICEVYDAESKSHFIVDVALPHSIQGFSNAFVLAAITPLIENAFQACPDGGTISISFIHDLEPAIRVENTYDGPLLPSDIVDEGRSTKGGHEGLGLSTVATLLRSRPGARLDVHEASDANGRLFSAIVTLGSK